jgi:hypothetical protein
MVYVPTRAGYRDWLGLPAEGPPRFLPFQEARAFVRNLGLHSSNEWEDWRMSGKRPSNIPSHPKDVYEKTGEWAGVRLTPLPTSRHDTSFLAKGRPRFHSVVRPYRGAT